MQRANLEWLLERYTRWSPVTSRATWHKHLGRKWLFYNCTDQWRWCMLVCWPWDREMCGSGHLGCSTRLYCWSWDWIDERFSSQLSADMWMEWPSVSDVQPDDRHWHWWLPTRTASIRGEYVTLMIFNAFCHVISESIQTFYHTNWYMMVN